MNVDRGRGKASWAQSMMEGVELSFSAAFLLLACEPQPDLFWAMRFHLPRLAG